MPEEKHECCFNCEHQNITETSYEWIECCCKIDKHWQNPYNSCENFESKDGEE